MIFINASGSVQAKQQKTYDQMTQYREALELHQTSFTIMDLKSPGCLSYPCNVFHYVNFEFQVSFRAEKLILHVPCCFQMQPRLEFPNLYTGEDTLHFNSQVANQACDSIITKAKEEAPARFGPKQHCSYSLCRVES